MDHEQATNDQVRVGVELARMVFRLEGLEEDKKEANADWTAQIKTCKKEIKRLAGMVQNPQPSLFDRENRKPQRERAELKLPPMPPGPPA